MLLASALVALFLGGFWLYCLTDAILTPASECRGMQKPAWIAVIVATFIGGAVAWLIVRQPMRTYITGGSRPPGPPRQAGGNRLPGPPSHVRLARWDDGVDSLDEEFYSGSQLWTDADDAVARHPAGRARAADTTRLPKGPDDDPEFLRALDRVIRGTFGADEEI
jgi:hypothetical protein